MDRVGNRTMSQAEAATTSEDKELALIWQEFKSHGSAEARDKLILHYAPVVKFVAARVSRGLPPSVDQADLISYGIFGLIDAINKFEPGRSIKFETYAISRIRGSIIDELRSLDWVPRSIRSKARRVEKIMGELENRFGRQPSDQEVADAMEVSVDELHEIYKQISHVSLGGLDELILGGDEDSGGLSLLETLEDETAQDPQAAFESEEMKTILSRVIDRLPERERRVVTLYYYEGLTLSQIGRVLGVSESRVSQMHTKAVLQLRSRLVEATNGQSP